MATYRACKRACKHACKHTNATGGSGRGVAAAYRTPSRSQSESHGCAIFNNCSNASGGAGLGVTAPY